VTKCKQGNTATTLLSACVCSVNDGSQSGQTVWFFLSIVAVTESMKSVSLLS